MVADNDKSLNSPPVKVAIIGSGLAGLSAAYYLSKENQKRLQGGEGPLFEVHLFEKVRVPLVDLYLRPGDGCMLTITALH